MLRSRRRCKPLRRERMVCLLSRRRHKSSLQERMVRLRSRRRHKSLQRERMVRLGSRRRHKSLWAQCDDEVISRLGLREALWKGLPHPVEDNFVVWLAYIVGFGVRVASARLLWVQISLFWCPEVLSRRVSVEQHRRRQRRRLIPEEGIFPYFASGASCLLRETVRAAVNRRRIGNNPAPPKSIFRNNHYICMLHTRGMKDHD